MKKTLVTFALLCFYAPVAVMACSSSSTSGGSGGSVTSIDSSKQAGSLSEAEKTQYCKDTQAYFAAQTSEADAKKSSCIAQAFSAIFQGGTPPKTDAEYQAKCKTAYQECLGKPVVKGDAGATTDNCASASKDLANCTATVGELNTCVQDTAATVKAAYAKFDTYCDTVQLDGGGIDKTAPTRPASCTALEAKCPSFASGDDK